MEANMKKAGVALSVIAALSAIISSCIGVFFTNGGVHRVVENIYGQQIALYGDGIYANDSVLKAVTTKGTDITVIIVGLLLLSVIVFYRSRKAGALVQAGLLSILLYSSAYVAMGISFNRLFLLYILQFGSSLFAFAASMNYVISIEPYNPRIYEKRLTGTGIFLIIGSCSIFIWLTYILPAVITGTPLKTIEIYTTEPTFVFDLAVILPSALVCGIALIRKNKLSYKAAPILLALFTGIGACVISQTMMQITAGIHLPTGQVFGLVASFVVLGSFATALNGRLLKYAK